MDRELQQYYEAQFALFQTKGWKDLVQTLESMKKELDTLRNVTPETLKHKQGELSVVNWLLAWPELVKAGYESNAAAAE